MPDEEFRAMKPFTLLVKPASADCNLRCPYCFYLDRASLYPGSAVHRMTDEVLELLIASYLKTPQPQYVFGWQGGEPLLMGFEFFRKAVDGQARLGPPGAVVANGLQTNGTLIDSELARLFADYHFLLGVSLDGPEPIHDHFRRNGAGAGTYAAVRRGIDCLQRHEVAFNILTLVTSRSARKAAEIYRFHVAQGFRHHQYIPCVEYAADRSALPWTVSATDWGRFLCDLFDEWYPRDTRRVSIRLFDSILARIVDQAVTVCHFGGDCRQYFVVEHNGDIYPCDFFVEAPLRLGNLRTDSWSALQASPVYRAFGEQKSQWNAHCAACRWVSICAGDCLKHRLCGGGSAPSLSRLCAGWKLFYEHTAERFERLAGEIQAARQAGRAPSTRPDGRAPGRNDLCGCGSGRKYKQCCGRIKPSGAGVG